MTIPTHRENSPVTQTTPEPTLSSLGGWPREKSPPPLPLASRQARSYYVNRATQTLLFSKSFDLAQVCHGNKICSKPALTWKLTLVLAFPGLCRGCILGTFSTLKSGMSPIILTVGANVPTHLRFMNGNITEVTPEKLQMSPYFSMVWVICPHFSKALVEHCISSTLHIELKVEWNY